MCIRDRVSGLPARCSIVATSKVAATTTIAAIASATESAATTSASATAILAWFGFVDLQGASVDFLTVELGDCIGALFCTGHFDKAKASRSSCLAIFNHTRRLDGAG